MIIWKMLVFHLLVLSALRMYECASRIIILKGKRKKSTHTYTYTEQHFTTAALFLARDHAVSDLEHSR